MPLVQSESPNLQIVEFILENLAKLRTLKRGWFDSEVEDIEEETLVFKIGEALRCFLIAKKLYPDKFSIFPLDDTIFFDDIVKVLKNIQKHGFYPSPYSQIPNVSDQYTDFAAFCLEFCDFVYSYAKEKNNKSISKLAQTVAKKSLNFLTTPKNFKNDENGCRWAGTNAYERIKRFTEYYTDVYFTSVVIIALRKVLEQPILNLDEYEKDRIRGLIRKAGKWIVNRADAGLLTGDERKNVKKLIYTTWGLRSLVETYDTQEEEVRRLIPPIVSAYLDVVDEKIEKEGILQQQEYLTVLSPAVGERLYYDDRSDWGGILGTLISLRKLPELESLLEYKNYKQIMDAIYNGLLLLRDPNNKIMV